MMKDNTMSVSDAEEDLNLMLESSPPARESSPTEREEEDSQFVKMQTELHSRGAELTKAWANLFSFITEYQAELVVKENSVEIAEKEIEQRKRQLEEMKPVVDAGNEEITQLQDEIRTKERLLSQAQSQLSVKERMLERVQSDLSCSRELLEKSQTDLLGKQNDLTRNRGDLERLKSDLKLKQEQIQIKDNLLKKLKNQLMNENAELKEQLERERRSHDLEKQSHELTKRSLVSQSMQSERRKRQRTDAVPCIEIPDSPPTLDLSDMAGDFGLSNIISMTTDTPSGPEQRRPSSEIDTPHISANVPDHSPSFPNSIHLHHMPNPTTPLQWDFATAPKVSRSSRCMVSPSITSQTNEADISENIPITDAAMTSSDTFFPLSVSEDVKPGIDTFTSGMQMDSNCRGNMSMIKPGTPCSGTSDSNQGPVPVSGLIPRTDGGADGKVATVSVFPTELWSGGGDMAINMVWSFAQTMDSAEAEDNDKDLNIWSLVETTDFAHNGDFEAVALAQDGDFETIDLSQEGDLETTDLAQEGSLDIADLAGNDDPDLKVWTLVETTELAGDDDFESSALAQDDDFKPSNLTQDARFETCNSAEDDDSDLQSNEPDFAEDHPDNVTLPDKSLEAKLVMKSSSVLQPEHAPPKHKIYKKTDCKMKAKLKRFKCDVCKKAFRHEGFLRKHKRQHTCKFECKFCQKTFSGRAYLEMHVKVHTDEKLSQRPKVLIDRVSDDSKEKVCNELEDDLTLLELKQKIAEKKSLECRYCKKAFSSKDSLTQHELTHNFRKKEFRCNFCQKAFSRKDEVAFHELTHIDAGNEKLHTSEKELKKFGEEEASDKVDLIKNKQINVTKSLLQCSYCEKIFSWRDSLRRHMLRHTGELAFKCSYCEKAFCRHDHLTRHERTHARLYQQTGHVTDHQQKDRVAVNELTNTEKDDHMTINKQANTGKMDHIKVKKQANTAKKSFRCSICKKAFLRKQHMKRHEQTHVHNNQQNNTGKKPFRCGVCKKGYSRKEHVRRHERSHARNQPKDPTRPFRCSSIDCQKSFTLNHHLQNHELTHTRLWQYQCSYCEKAFKWKSVMKIHEKNHKRAKPLPVFECSLCQMEFVYKSVYKKHVCRYKI